MDGIFVNNFMNSPLLAFDTKKKGMPNWMMIFVLLFSSEPAMLSNLLCMLCKNAYRRAFFGRLPLFLNFLRRLSFHAEQYQRAHRRLEYDETNSGTTQTSVPWRGAASEPPSRLSHLLATLVLKLWGLNGVNSLFFFFVKLGPTLSIAILA